MWFSLLLLLILPWVKWAITSALMPIQPLNFKRLMLVQVLYKLITLQHVLTTIPL